uniref:Uncharacterized protein n=2 Tax=Acrobeloides nanus TaxID=290746 RepID=A0A914EDU2_9BILA
MKTVMACVVIAILVENAMAAGLVQCNDNTGACNGGPTNLRCQCQCCLVGVNLVNALEIGVLCNDINRYCCTKPNGELF